MMIPTARNFSNDRILLLDEIIRNLNLIIAIVDDGPIKNELEEI